MYSEEVLSQTIRKGSCAFSMTVFWKVLLAFPMWNSEEKELTKGQDCYVASLKESRFLEHQILLSACKQQSKKLYSRAKYVISELSVLLILLLIRISLKSAVLPKVFSSKGDHELDYPEWSISSFWKYLIKRMFWFNFWTV